MNRISFFESSVMEIAWVKDTKKVLKNLTQIKVNEFEGLVQADLEWLNAFHANLQASFQRHEPFSYFFLLFFSSKSEFLLT